jgi:hypothetical protein
MHAFMAFQIACSLERLAADVTKGAVRRVVGGDGAGGGKDCRIRRGEQLS